MKFGLKTLLAASIVAAIAGCASNGSSSSQAASELVSAANNAERTEKNRARDQYRNPVETLDFFGLQADMTVVEIAPGGGWYSEILAPAVKGNGTLYAAHFPADSEVKYYQRSLAGFKDKVTKDNRFSEVKITEFAPLTHSDIAPTGSADMVLTFRNVHNWYMRQGDEGVLNAFQAFNKALKPGGVLGVVEHRLPEHRDDADQKRSGYMKQSYVVDIAKKAGFELVAESDVNANPLDSANHPKGVWTLPPRLALGDKNADQYKAIGESDRMTLKFKKL
ncbi:class I SAM-dependent methyltransferase [Pseudoalteromonas sp. MMG005]|uniref:class I SAM-dependent methyltransferase n=1 Tax=Pseudoalteromonas sp. MMG005 TaxID=2822682 RepID=UPI001B3A5305|nr:class I SAM-dependent methyltransferase [Pseudoalteromonas sp. MMG005]MBQ4843907.1 class I SAM-dependent methyltransferase [Pseudoalteromonas sp. MMG005]